MVEVKFLHKCAMLAAMVAFWSVVNGAVEPRFEGLRSNSRYMTLLEREAALKQQESNLIDKVEKGRSTLKVGDEASRKALESLEFDLMDVQSEVGAVSGEVSEIEQQWELKNLDISATAATATPTNGGVEIAGESVGSVVSSKLVLSLLSANDLALFKRSEQGERGANGDYVAFMEVYHKMRDLKQSYNQSEKEADAAPYYAEFQKLIPVSDSLLISLDDKWSSIYADKSYLFNLLMETLEREDILQKGESILRDGESKIPSSDDAATTAVEYDAQKRALLQYETLVAEVLKLSKAVDSLKNQSVLMNSAGDVVALRDVTIRERNFIDYEAIKFSSTPKYKPGQIPDAKLYKKGTIYRIQMGAYKTSQNPSAFRGAYPLSFDKALGFWTYYTGAYATMAEALEAQALCKKRGFNRPEIVVWRDGVRRNLTRQPLPATKGFRVIISGQDELSEGVEATIRKMYKDAQINRIGAGRYIVGDFKHQYIAEELVEALSFEDEELVCELQEIE